MWSAIDTAANAGGNAEKSSTTARISQTWLASQIGPMAFSITVRCSARRGPVASRSQTPPPKSAPPKIRYRTSAATMAAASRRSGGTAAHLVKQQHQHHRAEQQVDEGEHHEG